jgi:secreted trypsin-like serine protease
MAFQMRRRTRLRALLALITAVIAVAGALSASAANASEPSTRIVGGTVTNTQTYPYVMQITDSTQSQFCGGTLVSPTKVVTAAHCVDWITASEIRVIGGRTYLSASNGTVRAVTDVWIHPDWNPDKYHSDIAVLTLLKPMPYEPVPYMSSNATPYEPGRLARILGWGTTSENGSSSNQLRTARVPITSNARCQDGYPVLFDRSVMVCAGYTDGGVDTCQGDSGGPLIINGRLAGITSWGNGCARAKYPGVYTRLTTFSADVTEQINS